MKISKEKQMHRCWWHTRNFFAGRDTQYRARDYYYYITTENTSGNRIRKIIKDVAHKSLYRNWSRWRGEEL